MTAPGFNFPAFSASSIIFSAARSFTLPAGFKYSSFKSGALEMPAAAAKRDARKSGVLPMSSVTDEAMCSFFIRQILPFYIDTILPPILRAVKSAIFANLLRL